MTEGVFCIFCQDEAEIMVDHPEVMFGVCNKFECHKKLAEEVYDKDSHAFLSRNHKGIMLQIGNRKVFFKNDKRVMKGLPNKLKEILQR